MSPAPISRGAETVLLMICDPEAKADEDRRLDAAFWGEELVELIRLGYLRLTGTRWRTPRWSRRPRVRRWPSA